MKKELLKFLVLLSVALGAGPLSAQVYLWSKTASQNGAADPSINFSEGQSPSSVNDSARALMARVADWRDDSSGLLATSGGSTNYTVTTNSGLNATPNDGQLLAITMNVTNGTSATLAADGGTSFPIQSTAGSAVAAGTLVAGSPYTLKFSTSNSAWILRDFYGNPFIVPLGTVLPYSAFSAPSSNFAMANGQCISRTTYSAYFSLVGTQYGSCDGSTTFGVPDLRGRVIAGNDTMTGSNAGRLSSSCSPNSSTNAGVCGSQNITLTTNNLPPYTPVGSITGTASVGVGLSASTGGAATGGAFAPDVSTQLAAYPSGTRSNVVYNINNGSLAPSMSPQGGTSVPVATVQPSLILTFVVRIF